ncbi:MAG: serine--tRNA ligase [Candidatus Nanopelagicales bacterium]|nr:serine--tRNA ligase [Candidatus Nanopelagicales bacterium]MDZ4248916.1 serine--tRNA ligase [Candidatus Nanopelagicales bacterium]
MIDLQVLRLEPDAVRDSQRRRGADPALVDRALELDREWREVLRSFEAARAEQKRQSKLVGQLVGRKKTATGEALIEVERELAAAMAESGGLADAVKTKAAVSAAASARVDASLMLIDNIVDADAPVGAEEDFRLIATVGEPRDFAVEGFSPKDHLQIGQILGAIDTERAAKVSGARFYYLTGDAVLLELALLNLAMSLAVGEGFTPVLPPALVKPEAMAGTGFLGQAAENVYRLEADGLYLVGTAEVSLAAFRADEILSEADLPVRYVGFSPCFRREAGTHGRDTRGIIRVHQFDKVEMFSFCHPDDSISEHQRLLGWERQFMDLLEIPYRVIDVATGDLGASAARKFDIEAWIPTQNTYREVTSASNCTSFQARRLKIRFRSSDGKTHPVATLNGTLVAMPRIIVAILENHQTPDGCVRIPTALRPWLGGREHLSPSSP